MKKMLAAMLLMVSMNAIAQNVAYTISKDTKNGELVFNGPLSFDDLNNEPTFSWLKKGYEEYHPNAETNSYLHETLKNYKLVVFLGTWCDDSHDLIPRLERVLTQADFPAANLTMYGTDREKTTKNGEHKKYNITLVPTVIVFNNAGTEVGRITETASKSVEQDLMNFVSADMKGAKR